MRLAHILFNFTSHAAYIVLNPSTLPPNQKIIIDPLLDHGTVLNRRINQQYQVLAFSISIDRVSVADRCTDRIAQAAG